MLPEIVSIVATTAAVIVLVGVFGYLTLKRRR
jgi:preprotein translocase subunit Sss1